MAGFASVLVLILLGYAAAKEDEVDTSCIEDNQVYTDGDITSKGPSVYLLSASQCQQSCRMNSIRPCAFFSWQERGGACWFLGPKAIKKQRAGYKAGPSKCPDKELVTTTKKSEAKKETTKKPHAEKVTTKKPEEVIVTDTGHGRGGKEKELQASSVTEKKSVTTKVTTKKPEEVKVTTKKPDTAKAANLDATKVTDEELPSTSTSTTTQNVAGGFLLGPTVMGLPLWGLLFIFAGLVFLCAWFGMAAFGRGTKKKKGAKSLRSRNKDRQPSPKVQESSRLLERHTTLGDPEQMRADPVPTVSAPLPAIAPPPMRNPSMMSQQQHAPEALMVQSQMQMPQVQSQIQQLQMQQPQMQQPQMQQQMSPAQLHIQSHMQRQVSAPQLQSSHMQRQVSAPQLQPQMQSQMQMPQMQTQMPQMQMPQVQSQMQMQMPMGQMPSGGQMPPGQMPSGGQMPPGLALNDAAAYIALVAHSHRLT